MEKIIKVFYDQSGLPFKDKELTTHFPIVGSGFLGASNTTKIRFYYKNIGQLGDTYLAISKMPNGKQGSHLLNIKSQDEDGNYVELSLSEWYFQAKGDVYISLKVYWGGVEISDETDPETGFVIISGEQVKFVTGAIKMSVNYAPIGDVPDYRDEFTAYETILELVREKLDMIDSIYATSDISLLSMSLFAENQIFFDYTRKEFYKKVNGTAEMILDIYDKDEIGSLLSNKVDKLTTLGEHAYTHNGATQSEISISENAAGGSVPKRTSAGNIYVGLTPSVNGHATSKKYVDDSITSARNYLLGVINDAGHSLGLVESTDPSKEYDYIIQLKDKAGNVISSVELDLPLEQIITSGYYDEDTKSVVLVLDNGSEVRIPVGDLIEGLVDEQGLQTALAPYIKEINVSSVLSTNDLLEQVGVDKYFILDNMGSLCLCYISEDNGAYTLNVISKDIAYHNSFTENTLVRNLLGDGTLDIDYLPVITLSQAMQTLTIGEMEIANQDNSIIKYNGRIYHKANETESAIEYVSADYDIANGSTNTVITKYEISVNKSTRATTMLSQNLNVYSVGEMDALLNEKANTSGDYPALTVGKSLTTKQIENINDEVGSTQTNPFLFQGTGTNDNTTETPTSPVAKHLELRGNTLVWNQLISNPTAVVNFSTTDESPKSIGSVNLVLGHKYLFIAKQSAGLSSNTRNTFVINGEYETIDANANLKKGFKLWIWESNASGTQTLFWWAHTPSDNFTITDIQAIDLTLMFGSGHEITNGLQFIRDYPDLPYSYNEGKLKSCKSSKLVTIGCNAFDGLWTQKDEFEIETTNFIRVIPKQTYSFDNALLGTDGRVVRVYQYDYNKVLIPNGNSDYTQLIDDEAGAYKITLDDSCCFVKIRQVNSGITVDTAGKTNFRLYWNESHDYVDYDKHEYELPEVELRSAGSVYDEIKPNGTYTQKIGVVNLGSLNWFKQLDYFFSEEISDFKAVAQSSDVPNILSDEYLVTDYQNLQYTNNAISSYGTSKRISVRDTSKSSLSVDDFKTAMSGIMLYFELETPIVSEESLFAENIEVDDFGTMEFVPSDSTEEVIIPQGNKFFYPADYVAFIDDLYKVSKDGGEDADVNNFVTQHELTQALSNAGGDAENLADEYSSSSTYALGDLVIHDNVLYKCTTAITTPESWDSTHWAETNVASDFVNLTGTQTITGVKTFKEMDFYFGSGNLFKFVRDTQYNLSIKVDGNFAYTFQNNAFIPRTNNNKVLGDNSFKWKEAYINKIIDEYGSYSSDNVFNVINASDIVNNTLTQAQYDLINNGKPTIIKGTWQNYLNPVLLTLSSDLGGEKIGFMFGTQTYYNRILVYVINNSTRVISVRNRQPIEINSWGELSKLNNISVNQYYKKPQASVSLSDGGTITDKTLKELIQNEQPIKLNGFTCYFSCDDGTNYQYVSTRYDSSANKNHINVITINKSTWVATFHTSDIALN